MVGTSRCLHSHRKTNISCQVTPRHRLTKNPGPEGNVIFKPLRACRKAVPGLETAFPKPLTQDNPNKSQNLIPITQLCMSNTQTFHHNCDISKEKSNGASNSTPASMGYQTNTLGALGRVLPIPCCISHCHPPLHGKGTFILGERRKNSQFLSF